MRPLHRTAPVAVALAAALLLGACSSGSDDASAADPESTSTSTPGTSSSGGTGDGTTTPGSALTFGDPALVDWEQAKDRATRLRVTVLGAAQGTLADFAGFDMSDPYQRRASYYYVRVAVRNAGKVPLRKATPVPLWGVSGANTLLPAVRFTSSFERCPTAPLPAGMKPGATLRTCLVYLSPKKGSLEGVSYRPAEDFDPIVWTGTVSAPPKKGDKR